MTAKHATRVPWTEETAELLESVRRLSGMREPEILERVIAAGLRDSYRTMTRLEWRPGAPNTHAAAKRARRSPEAYEAEVARRRTIDAKRGVIAPREPEAIDADRGDAA